MQLTFEHKLLDDGVVSCNHTNLDLEICTPVGRSFTASDLMGIEWAMLLRRKTTDP